MGEDNRADDAKKPCMRGSRNGLGFTSRGLAAHGVSRVPHAWTPKGGN